MNLVGRILRSRNRITIVFNGTQCLIDGDRITFDIPADGTTIDLIEESGSPA